MRCPNLYNAYDLILTPERHRSTTVSFDGKTWYPARTEASFMLWHRVQRAWMVLTGRADALVWPGQEH